MSLDALEGMARIRRTEARLIVVKWLQDRLDKAKDDLTVANEVNFRKIQGRIEELKEQIKFVNNGS